MKKVLFSLLLTTPLFATESFGLRCENNEKGDSVDIKEIYFFNKTNRFTGYYSVKENAKLNISGVSVPYESERNKCDYDGEERNRYFYNCKSEYSGKFEKPKTGIGIDREELVILRSYTTSKYNYEGMQIFSCEKLSKEDSKSKLDFFKKEKKELNKNIKEIKKSVNSKNKI